MCQFRLSKDAIQEKYHLHFDGDFDDYFATEHSVLEALAIDGLLTLNPNHGEVTPIGRLLIRNIVVNLGDIVQMINATTAKLVAVLTSGTLLSDPAVRVEVGRSCDLRSGGG